MEMILKVATSVSTPIAVAGLIVGVLLIIFYAILRLKIFPKLNRVFGTEVISNMMRYLYRLAMVALSLGFIAYITPIILAAVFSSKKIPADEAKAFIDFDTTLQKSIKYIAGIDGHPAVQFNNCNEALLNTKVKKGTYTGGKYADIIFQLQFNLEEIAPKEIYQSRLNDQGLYEINCHK